MAIVFAVITLFCYGIDYLFIRKGLVKSPNPMLASFITLSVNVSFFLVYVLLFESVSLVSFDLVYFFIIAGIMAPGLARVFSYKGLQTVGMSIAAPIVNAETLFAFTLAVIFLGEPITFMILTGVLSVVAGLVILGYESGRKNPGTASKKIRYRYLIYPLLASFCYGTSIFLRKLGLNVLGSPIIGAFFTSATSWLVILITVSASGNLARWREVKKESLFCFLIGGCLTCIGWYALFHALHIGRVSIITPIATSYSLITLLFGYLFLRDVERITKRIVIATVLVVGGIVLLCLGK